MACLCSLSFGWSSPHNHCFHHLHVLCHIPLRRVFLWAFKVCVFCYTPYYTFSKSVSGACMTPFSFSDCTLRCVCFSTYMYFEIITGEPLSLDWLRLKVRVSFLLINLNLPNTLINAFPFLNGDQKLRFTWWKRQI